MPTGGQVGVRVGEFGGRGGKQGGGVNVVVGVV